MGSKTSRLIVDALLGGQGVGDFMASFDKPYTPMLKIFGHPKENFADDLWDKYLTDPKRLSKVHLKVQVIHQKPIEHGVHGQYTQEEKTFVHFDVSEPPWASWTGHLCKAREGMEGYGVFVRLPKFIKRLKRNWPKTGEEMHNQIKLFLREIARPGDYDDVKP